MNINKNYLFNPQICKLSETEIYPVWWMTDMVRINHSNNRHHDNHTSDIESDTDLYPLSVLLTKISQSRYYSSYVVSHGV